MTSSAIEPSKVRVDRRLILLLGLAIVAVALVVADPNALCLLPALAVAAPLLLRSYPGETILAALSDGARPHWARPRSRARRPTWLPARVVPRGGLLLAGSLAVRPPPLPAGSVS